ncbi:unknown protein [Seminavis robusta]|uniref:Uncharacterized protein n=1 Tax=Seminavis robusta TaxID=568900 RepID=A0A9N8HPL0_9STRA|nr:unknown protein [Seminavis robusta]|eukprot:Sro1188_g250630.1 n/a (276) ;mRNA; f:29889-30826
MSKPVSPASDLSTNPSVVAPSLPNEVASGYPSPTASSSQTDISDTTNKVRKKCIDIYRKHEDLPPLEPISLDDLLGTKLVKYSWNGKRLMLNPDPNAHPDHEDFENMKILKLALPHPHRHPELLSIVCKAFDYDEMDYRLAYDRHLACFNLITDVEIPTPWGDDSPEDTFASAFEELEEKFAKEDAKEKEEETNGSETLGSEDTEDGNDSEEIDSPPAIKGPGKGKRSFDVLSQVATAGTDFDCDSSFSSLDAAERLLSTPPAKKQAFAVKSPEY